MMVYIEYEAGEKLQIPYENIIKDVVGAALSYVGCPYEAEVSVLLTDDEGIRAINLESRGIDAPTDVLSFPFGDFDAPGDFAPLEERPEDYFNTDSGELMMGDIVISVDRVISQAREYGHSETRELAFLTAHSMLHLSGYDHVDDAERERMEAMQRKILDMLGYTR